jgi:hypothetical protein
MWQAGWQFAYGVFTRRFGEYVLGGIIYKMERSRSFFGARIKTVFRVSFTLILAMLSVGPLAGQSAGRTDQTSISKAKENKAKEDVVKLVETLRQQKGLPKLQQFDDPELRKDACESAKRGRGRGLIYLSPGTSNVMAPSGLFGDVGNLSTFSYMAEDPSQPSPELQIWATRTAYESRSPSRIAVGVCFSSTTEHADGAYWIDVGYYMSAIKTFLYRVTFMWD